MYRLFRLIVQCAAAITSSTQCLCYGNGIIICESPIICKLQFRFENQEPGKVSHTRRCRMNLYQNNYAFSAACKMLD